LKKAVAKLYIQVLVIRLSTLQFISLIIKQAKGRASFDFVHQGAIPWSQFRWL